MAPEVLFWPVEGPPGRSKLSLNGGHKCQLCLEPSHYHLFHIPPPPPSPPPPTILSHTREAPKRPLTLMNRKPTKLLHEAHTVLREQRQHEPACPAAEAVNPDSCRQCCLVPTGMTGIQALNVSVFLCWLQQRRQAGGKGHITSTSPTCPRLSGPAPSLLNHGER